MRLSFIIPCYNSAKTIVRCLDSIYALPIPESDFEVIAVNDGSTDETRSIIEDYAQAHTQLILINHLVNRCLGAARNSGMAIAKGNVIAFVDSDDEVAPGMARALEMMEEKLLDMVAMRLERFDENGDIIGQLTLPYTDDEVYSGIALQETHPFWNFGGCTNYLYTKSLLECVQYPFVEGAFYEDVDFVCNHLYQAKRISYCNDCGYRQFSITTSITHTFSYKHVFSYAFLGARMLSLYDNLEYKSKPFALYALEGGGFNIMKAFKYLLKLRSVSDIRAFYNLFDSRCNRKQLTKYNEPAYCWTWWTKVGVRDRFGMILLAGTIITLGIPGLINRHHK